MQSTERLKKELKFNSGLADILDALKGIASSEFRALERKKERFGKFLEAFDGFFRLIDLSGIDHPFARAASGRTGIVIVTSDEGFMGALNTRVVSAALGYPGADEAALMVVGRKGAGSLAGQSRPFKEFPGITQGNNYELAAALKEHIMLSVKSSEFSRLVVVYPRPVTFTRQDIEILKLLPCGELFKKRGEFSAGDRDVIVESRIPDIMEYLAGTWIAEKLYEVFEDSKLSEFSARTIQLEESYQSLLRQGKALRLRYFRSYHDRVDKSMRDIFSSVTANRRRAL